MHSSSTTFRLGYFLYFINFNVNTTVYKLLKFCYCTYLVIVSLNDHYKKSCLFNFIFFCPFLPNGSALQNSSNYHNPTTTWVPENVT